MEGSLTIVLPGIDVSMYQGVIDWQSVRSAGYDFAGIKATEGLLYRDPQFARNWDRCEARGIKRIAYHFFHADLVGKEQADFFHTTIHQAGGLLAGDCAMLDLETTNGIDTARLIQEAESFVSHFLATTQCGLYIYTNRNFWDAVLGGPRSAILGLCALWDASWGSTPQSPSNWPSGASIWQWTDSLTVPGITGHVDGDRFMGTLAQYNGLASQSGRH